MTRYSIATLVRNAFRAHEDWPRVWRSAEPKAAYDVVIVGAGGHGLATAYYLAKEHGITNVAVLEKGWLGGGNTGRNTTIIRSNYLFDESAVVGHGPSPREARMTSTLEVGRRRWSSERSASETTRRTFDQSARNANPGCPNFV